MKRSIAGMAAFVLFLHVAGFGLLFLVIVPAHYHVGAAGVYGVGLGITAYTLGMRHAFDADHIAAIDNTTRKLMGGERRPLSVGFWFSLGHSSVVFALCLLLGLGVRALAGQVESDSSTLQQITGVIGVSVSGVFLYVIGIINLVLATEISLLVLAGGAAAFALPWYAVLTLPVLFAAGMSLLDAADGIFMNYAYGWAFAKPVRKVYYNLTITGLSVAVALVIGTIELDSIITDKLGITSGPLAAIGRLDLNYVGFVIVGLFVATWAVALLVWRFGRIEQKWNAHLTQSPANSLDRV